jgi:hypothetical protein
MVIFIHRLAESAQAKKMLLVRNWIVSHTIPAHDDRKNKKIYEVMCQNGDTSACQSLADISVQEHMKSDMRAQHEMRSIHKHPHTSEKHMSAAKHSDSAAEDIQSRKMRAKKDMHDQSLCDQGNEAACRETADAAVWGFMSHDKRAQKEMNDKMFSGGTHEASLEKKEQIESVDMDKTRDGAENARSQRGKRGRDLHDIRINQHDVRNMQEFC